MSGPDVVGFELVQDFRMPYWGDFCNYRYEQHDQFYNDGRFRIVGESYGRGCSYNGIYRPVMLIHMGLGGAGRDSFAIWDGSAWQPQAVEGWWSQAAPYTAHGFKWRVTDQGGRGYYIEPGQGQFGDGGRGDYAFIYATRHHAAEGDTDLGAIGFCCNDDYQQGPEQFLNGESIAGQDLVLWYVAQMQTQVADGSNYCWTVQTDPTVETYPCAAGPMFVPRLAANFTDDAPVAPPASMAFTSTSAGQGPLTYLWNFGDGSGSSSMANPVHAYSLPGLYTVTLTVTDTTGAQTASHVVAAGDPPLAGFDYALSKTVSNTVILTSTTSGSPQMSFMWNFGDATTSTAQAPRCVSSAA